MQMQRATLVFQRSAGFGVWGLAFAEVCAKQPELYSLLNLDWRTKGSDWLSRRDCRLLSVALACI